MALSKEQIKLVEDTIKNSLRNKFNTYNPEPAIMPFHTRLLGKDRKVVLKNLSELFWNGQRLFYQKTQKQKLIH